MKKRHTVDFRGRNPYLTKDQTIYIELFLSLVEGSNHLVHNHYERINFKSNNINKTQEKRIKKRKP